MQARLSKLMFVLAKWSSKSMVRKINKLKFMHFNTSDLYFFLVMTI